MKKNSLTKDELVAVRMDRVTKLTLEDLAAHIGTTSKSKVIRLLVLYTSGIEGPKFQARRFVGWAKKFLARPTA